MKFTADLTGLKVRDSPEEEPRYATLGDLARMKPEVFEKHARDQIPHVEKDHNVTVSVHYWEVAEVPQETLFGTIRQLVLRVTYEVRPKEGA